ncbi:MAG: alternative ribosome rescue aminoacyl-tRNA hydrolase ArfB [Bauldia sp.]
MRIDIAPGLSIDSSEIEERFIRAAGPGGQNVNKVASAVQIRFSVARSPSLSADIRERLARIAGRRLTGEGDIVITAQRFRTQERNRADAVERLADLIRRAAVVPVLRRATRPTQASRTRRLDAKARRGATKGLRQRPPGED